MLFPDNPKDMPYGGKIIFLKNIPYSHRNSCIKIIVTVFIFILGGQSQDFIVPVWSDTIPGSIKDTSYIEALDTDKPNRILRVSNPQLLVYLPKSENSDSKTAVLICPGGGYRRLAMDVEGYDVAGWLNANDITAIILKYRLPDDRIMINKKIGPLQDALQAMRTIRKMAEKWNINPKKTGIMGFSAGGHLAASLSTHFSDSLYFSKVTFSARPDFSILVYPVISMDSVITHRGSQLYLLGENPTEKDLLYFSLEKQVSANTPPAFLVHAADDPYVSVMNSLGYFKALLRHKVKSEIHIYERGGHGFGMGNVQYTNSDWTNAVLEWMRMHDFINQK